MEPTQEFSDAIYRERILRARAMSPDDKLFAGPRIFERVCRIMADGIRSDFPDATPDEVRQILRQRLAIARRLEENP